MKDFLNSAGIEFYSVIPLAKCKIIKEYLLTKNGFDQSANVITMLIPYRSKNTPVNLSVYASVKDYHYFVTELAEKLESYIKERHPEALFKVFADHSPIDEVHAACISGLGFIGDNGLLINEKYSSFVFLAECVTNLSPFELGMEYAPVSEVKGCLHCGACAKACPCGCIKKGLQDMDELHPKSQCLSAITQKKGELSDAEIRLMLDNGSIWGCDICQNACPYTNAAKFSHIEYFNCDIITMLDSDTLASMSDEDFKKRPFSWRGRSVIERNVKLYEEKIKPWLQGKQ